MSTTFHADAESSTTTGISTLPRLLVATAGDRESRGAILVAAALSARDHSDVLALGVALPFPRSLEGLFSMRTAAVIDEDDRRAVMKRVEGSLHSLDAGAAWTKQAMVGMPADVIDSVATASRASMILLGARRHRTLDRVFGGETAIAVMRRAHVPVLSTPPGVRELPRHALVAVDFTRASEAAADVATQLIAGDGLVTVAHVCAFGGAVYREGDLVDIYRTGARAKLDQVVCDLRARSGARVLSTMLEGEPATALLDYARREQCDLIALGGHEQGLMDRILLGSVRTQVLRGARCSVLIVPPKAVTVQPGREPMIKTDAQLQKDIIEELRWDPAVGMAEIGVAAKLGVVTLTGQVDSLAKKYAATRAAERVAGVRAVAEDLKVVLPHSHIRTDTDLAHSVVSTLRWDVQVPDDSVKARVEDGWVTLEGKLEWQYQIAAAERAVRNLTGVRGVSNQILLKTRASAPDVKHRIETALKRHAELDANQIQVDVLNGHVTLTGKVRSWAERQQAEVAAWSAPGVTKVDDELAVST
jgi:osmotically-inducible protein OsmY/nucleotide-binding universal stress UspA family protein